MIGDWGMDQDAVYKKVTGHDGWNTPTYEPDVPLKVRWQFKQQLIIAANGKEVMCEAEVWCPLEVTPKAGDHFEYKGQLYVVENAGLPVDLYGEESWWKLFLKAVA